MDALTGYTRSLEGSLIKAGAKLTALYQGGKFLWSQYTQGAAASGGSVWKGLAKTLPWAGVLGGGYEGIEGAAEGKPLKATLGGAAAGVNLPVAIPAVEAATGLSALPLGMVGAGALGGVAAVADGSNRTDRGQELAGPLEEMGGGMVAGGTAGVFLGSVVPGIGAVIGGLGGALAGAVGGAWKGMHDEKNYYEMELRRSRLKNSTSGEIPFQGNDPFTQELQGMQQFMNELNNFYFRGLPGAPIIPKPSPTK